MDAKTVVVLLAPLATAVGTLVGGSVELCREKDDTCTRFLVTTISVLVLYSSFLVWFLGLCPCCPRINHHQQQLTRTDVEEPLVTRSDQNNNHLERDVEVPQLSSYHLALQLHKATPRYNDVLESMSYYSLPGMEKSSNMTFIPAKELTITWADNPYHWALVPNTDGSRSTIRFPEMMVLSNVCLFGMSRTIGCRLLHPATQYTVVLIFSLTMNTYGFDTCPVDASISVNGQNRSVTAVMLQAGHTTPYGLELPRPRDDGWMEVTLGSFYAVPRSGYHDCVGVGLLGRDSSSWKGGLAVAGIEFRNTF